MIGKVDNPRSHIMWMSLGWLGAGKRPP